jgi:carboxyl-terminal processing protease
MTHDDAHRARPVSRRTVGPAVLVAVLALSSGAARAQGRDEESDPSRGREVLSDPEALFRRVMTHIEDSYVDEVERGDLYYAAIRGMVRSLDPHSDFLDPEEYRAFQDDLSGIYGGAGFQVEYRGGSYIVVKVFPDSPAARMDIREGDVLLEVNGEPLFGLSMMEIVEKMRGDIGTVLEVRLRREEEEPRTVRLVRQTVEMPTVQAEFLEPGYALVRIHSAAKLDEQLRTLDARSPHGLRGAILDMRDNPGGVVAEAVAMAEMFLTEGTILSTRGRADGETEEETARPGERWETLPVAVVVNGYTASAAEILAAALQDNARALVVGAQTFGKGTVQRVVELLDGSALRLTVARLYTPSGAAIQGNGIIPDLTVGEAEEPADLTPLLRESALPGALPANEEEEEDEILFDASTTISDLAVRLAYQFLRLQERRKPEPQTAMP